MNTKTIRYRNIDDYVASFPPELRKVLEQIRQTVRKAAPGAEEMIKYNMPAFSSNGNVVYFGAFRHHIGLFPSPSGVPAFEKELSAYKTGKGSVQFPLDHSMPLSLISRIVKYVLYQR
jgi:uncharacterized protein YdhG (YjbR/CyaY superfamily)